MTPIREAFVVAGPDDDATVAGVPLLVRTILALQRAGIERCTVVGARALPRDPRIRCVLDAAPALAPPADDVLRLVVGAGAVVDTTLLRALQERARPGEVLELQAGGTCVRVAPGHRLAANGARPAPPGAGVLRSLAEGAGAVEAALLRGLENPRDGWLDRMTYRRLSRPLTRLLLHTPLGPSAVTLAGLALGVAGGLALAIPGRGSLVAGVALLLASGVLDCSDGDLARIRFAESRLGHVLDVVGDTLVHVSLLAGIALRLRAQGGVPGHGVLVLLGVGVLGAFAAITWSEVTEEQRRRAGGWENRILDRVLSPLTTRDWYVFPVLFALAGRLDWLVPAAAVGANVFWPVAAALVARVVARG